MPTDRAHLRKYSSLLRQHINPPPNECKIKVVAMVGRHNVHDMIGYVHKSRGAPVQAAAGTDLGDGDGDEAVEDNDSDGEGTSSTPGRDPAWT